MIMSPKKISNFTLIPGRQDDPLAKEVSKFLGVELVPVEFIRFRGKGILGGETKQFIQKNLRGTLVYIVWSILDTNDELVQILGLAGERLSDLVQGHKMQRMQPKLLSPSTKHLSLG